jgi:four helix bundle protein
MHYRSSIIWRKSMDLAKSVYSLIRHLPKEEVYGMRSQLTRAAVSVVANVAEGWTRESVKERAHFWSIAQGSLAETDTYITLCEELGWMTVEDTSSTKDLVAEVGRILSALRTKQRDTMAK